MEMTAHECDGANRQTAFHLRAWRRSNKWSPNDRSGLQAVLAPVPAPAGAISPVLSAAPYDRRAAPSFAAGAAAFAPGPANSNISTGAQVKPAKNLCNLGLLISYSLHYCVTVPLLSMPFPHLSNRPAMPQKLVYAPIHRQRVSKLLCA